MKLFKACAVILVAAALGACSTVPSEEEFKLGSRVIRESPTARNQVVADCVARTRRSSAVERRNMAALMGVSETRAAAVFCSRIVQALAQGRVSRNDVVQAQRSGDYSKFLRILQRS